MVNQRIRLGILLNSLAPYGAENFVLNHVRHHDRTRYDITVCHLRPPHTLGPALREAGAEVVCLAEERRPSLGLGLRLARLARRLDVLQTHIGYAGVAGRLVGRGVGVPVVVSTEQTVRRSYGRLLTYAIDHTLRLAHANVYITQAVFESFVRQLPGLDREAPIIITNGIDTREIARLAKASRDAARAELGLSARDFAFANVARLHPSKGQPVAIEALARVRAAHPHASLWIIGDGPDREALLALARQHGVADAVHLLGQRLDVHRLLGAFDAYVHPAHNEGLGIAVLEAMAAGLPTVASDVDGIPEFVRHERTGWLVRVGDVAGLAGHMTRLAGGDPGAAAVSAAGQALVQREHDVRGAVAAYEALYERLLLTRSSVADRSAAPR